MDKIEVFFPGGKRVDAKYNGHLIKTDQMTENGGQDSAPEPFALFLTSLATCAGIYALSFCQTRDIPTDGFKIIQTVTRDEETRKIIDIELDAVLPPEFPAKYEKAVIRAMNLCAVKKIILDPPPMEIKTSRQES